VSRRSAVHVVFLRVPGDHKYNAGKAERIMALVSATPEVRNNTYTIAENKRDAGGRD
jgi:hypothetical protein